MDFPVYLSLGPWKIHPHLLFETIAYSTAFQLLLRHTRRGDVIPPAQRSLVMIGGLVGALVGTKLLVLLQYGGAIVAQPDRVLQLLVQGKTIVGVLLGGVVGVELTKKIIGVKVATGDAFVYPLLVGTAIGRIGCFLTGLSDRTYGIATTLPWGVNFGDGISRHPTQLYEILFLLGLLVVLRRPNPRLTEIGDRFRLYMIAYLSFRLAIDFIKPDRPPWGLSAIQVACVLGLVYYWPHLRRFLRAPAKP